MNKNSSIIILDFSVWELLNKNEISMEDVINHYSYSNFEWHIELGRSLWKEKVRKQNPFVRVLIHLHTGEFPPTEEQLIEARDIFNSFVDVPDRIIYWRNYKDMIERELKPVRNLLNNPYSYQKVQIIDIDNRLMRHYQELAEAISDVSEISGEVCKHLLRNGDYVDVGDRLQILNKMMLGMAECLNKSIKVKLDRNPTSEKLKKHQNKADRVRVYRKFYQKLMGEAARNTYSWEGPMYERLADVYFNRIMKSLDNQKGR